MMHNESPQGQIQEYLHLLTVCEDALTGQDPDKESLAVMVQSARWGIADALERMQQSES